MMSPLFEMTMGDVFAVLDVLDSVGVRVWVAGGWGVDALLGHQTRRHGDLDLITADDERQVDIAIRALGSLELQRIMHRPPSALMPRRIMLGDARGRSVDLLAASLGRAPFRDGGGGPAFVRGRLNGRCIDCISAPLQLRLHEGFPCSTAERTDVAALRAHLDALAPPCVVGN